MIKLTRIPDSKLPIGWISDDVYNPIKDTGLCVYRQIGRAHV